MANKIVIKHRAGSTGEPTLDQGEIAANIFDKRAFVGTGAGNIIFVDKEYIDTGLAGKLDIGLKGAANGLAELDSNGTVPASQLPSYVDDVLEYANFASFPATGEGNKVYIDIETNTTYRWSGTQYVSIGSGDAGLQLGTTSSTAHRGDHGSAAYNHSLINSGNPHNVTKTDVGLGAVPNIDATNADNHTQGATNTVVTIAEKANFNAAYGWGNHAAAGYIGATGVTYENLAANGDIGTLSTQVAQGDHNHDGVYATAGHDHAGVYEPANADIAKYTDAVANYTGSLQVAGINVLTENSVIDGGTF